MVFHQLCASVSLNSQLLRMFSYNAHVYFLIVGICKCCFSWDPKYSLLKCSHLYGFSPVCVHKCYFSWGGTGYFFCEIAHIYMFFHLYGFSSVYSEEKVHIILCLVSYIYMVSPVWVRKCCDKLEFHANSSLQQLYGFSPVWDCKCCFSWECVKYSLLHW